MPIEVPSYSSVSPQRVPQGEGSRVPGGYRDTQFSIYSTPMNRNEADAGLFSGGLAGLQAVAQTLQGPVAQNFRGIAQHLRESENERLVNNTRLAQEQADNMLQSDIDANYHNPEAWESALEKANNYVRDTALAEDMPPDVKQKIEHMVAMGNAHRTGTLLSERGRKLRQDSVASSVETATVYSEQGRGEEAVAVIQNNPNISDPDKAKLARQFRRDAAVNTLIGRIENPNDPFGPRDVLRDFDDGEYGGLDKADIRTMRNYAQSAWRDTQIKVQQDIQYGMTKGKMPSEEEMRNRLGQEAISQEFFDRYMDSRTEEPLTQEQFMEIMHGSEDSFGIMQYDPIEDATTREQEQAIEQTLTLIKARGDEIHYKILRDTFEDLKKQAPDSPYITAKEMIKTTLDELVTSQDKDSLKANTNYELWKWVRDEEKAGRYPSGDQIKEKVDSILTDPKKVKPSSPLAPTTTIRSATGEAMKPWDAIKETFDERSRAAVESTSEGARPVLASILSIGRDIGSRHGVEVRAIEGFRSQARQDELYKQGRSTPGKVVTWTRNSRHTHGNALDLGVFKDGVYMDDKDSSLSTKVYREIAAEAKRRGVKIKWGGTFGDPPHFEVVK